MLKRVEKQFLIRNPAASPWSYGARNSAIWIAPNRESPMSNYRTLQSVNEAHGKIHMTIGKHQRS
jgi:hypothetical protein